ncbi:MAG: bifunctional hydroxymethylpyrimidine kinase/phosphomethylpyrimidine kinase [Clostridiales bacterium]|nr:bifunctional hydroxymethylpyrimidine kinase/phosphomethylpyrimidine kinase [Clostridiales bacterium]
MKTVLAISDTVENTEFDLSRCTATIKDLDLDPMVVVPVFYWTDGTSEKNEVTEIIDYVFGECETAAVAIGYMTDESVISYLSDKLENVKHAPVVAAPSLISDKGEILVTEDTYYMIIDNLLPKVQLLIINSLEAETLCGFECPVKNDLMRAAKKIFNDYGCHVLIRGNENTDGESVLCVGDGTVWIENIIPAPGFDTKKYTLFAAAACAMALGGVTAEAAIFGLEFVNGVSEFQKGPEPEPEAPKAQTPVVETPKAEEPKAEVKPEAVKAEPAAVPMAKKLEDERQKMDDLIQRAKSLQYSSRSRFNAPIIGNSMEMIPPAKQPDSLVSPAKPLRDIARNIEFHTDDEPTAVTSAIEKKPEPRSEVSALSNPSERIKNETNSSIRQLQSLKDRLNKMTGSDSN